MKSIDQVDEAVVIVDADPAWPELFAAEAARVRPALPPSSRVEHVGSTAVAGMSGKPIVDLLVGAHDMTEAARIACALEPLGYEDFGEVFIRGRRYLRRRGPPHFNIAIAVDGGAFFKTQLAVRDYLRTHPDEAHAYAAAKRAAFARGARQFSTYSQAKQGALEALMAAALAWAASAQ